MLFYAQCLDRPAFRTYFNEETSFSAFDRAMEDTLLALNTGYWRTREGALIERAKGKAYVAHPQWRAHLERIAEIIEGIRTRFQEAVGFTGRLYDLRRGYASEITIERRLDAGFRRDVQLGDWMDAQRQEAIEIMNSMLEEIGLQPLRGMRER